jgi:hypothetical protein
MQEKAPSMRESLHEKLCKLFLYSFLTQPNLLKGLVAKHIEVPEDNVILREEKTVKDDNDNILYMSFTLLIFEYEFVVRFDRRVEAPREIEVPKVVNKPKKWYQRTPDTMVIVEKKPSSDKPLIHWLIAAID